LDSVGGGWKHNEEHLSQVKNDINTHTTPKKLGDTRTRTQIQNKTNNKFSKIKESIQAGNSSWKIIPTFEISLQRKETESSQEKGSAPEEQLHISHDLNKGHNR